MATPHADLQHRLATVQGHYLESGWMPAALDESALVRSWGRCASSGLRPQQRVEFDTVGRARLSEVDDRYGGFARTARPEMDRLLQSFNQSDYAVLLASADGVLIDALGHPDNQALRLKALARRGVDIAERRVGTTALSVASAEWRAHLVHADAHYCEDNRVFFCVAAPIEGPQGEHVAVIDVTGCERVPQFDALSLVRDAAVAIENLLFRAAGDRVLLRFHHRAELIGTPAEAIVAVTPDGRVAAANRAALRYLNRNRAELATSSFETLFGRRLAPLLGRAAAGRSFDLHLVTGAMVQAVVDAGAGTAAPRLDAVAGSPADDGSLAAALAGARQAGERLIERAMREPLGSPVRARFDDDAWAALVDRASPAEADRLRRTAVALGAAAASPAARAFDRAALDAAWTAEDRRGAGTPPPAPTLRTMETALMRETLQRCDGNVSRAARALGVSRNTLYRRLGRP